MVYDTNVAIMGIIGYSDYDLCLGMAKYYVLHSSSPVDEMEKTMHLFVMYLTMWRLSLIHI